MRMMAAGRAVKPVNHNKHSETSNSSMRMLAAGRAVKPVNSHKGTRFADRTYSKVASLENSLSAATLSSVAQHCVAATVGIAVSSTPPTPPKHH